MEDLWDFKMRDASKPFNKHFNTFTFLIPTFWCINGCWILILEPSLNNWQKKKCFFHIGIPNTATTLYWYKFQKLGKSYCSYWAHYKTWKLREKWDSPICFYMLKSYFGNWFSTTRLMIFIIQLRCLNSQSVFASSHFSAVTEYNLSEKQVSEFNILKVKILCTGHSMGCKNVTSTQVDRLLVC